MPNIYTTTWADISVPIIAKRFGKNSESADSSGIGQATVSYMVNWSDRWTFMREILGSPQLSDIADTSSLLYRLPLQYPDNPALYALHCDSEPLENPSGRCSSVMLPEQAYNYAWVTVTYGTPPYPTATLYTVETKSGSSRVTLPGQSYTFASDGTAIDQDVGIPVSNQEIQVTFYRVPYFDDSAFLSYQDKVNSATFRGYSAGTVLFNPMTSTFTNTIGAGSPLYEVTFSFTVRTIPWNKALRPDTGVWDDIQDSLSNPPFGSADFNDIFN